MKNKLTDLNDHMFAQLERLNEEGLDEKQLQDEIARSKALTGLAKHIVGNARLILDGQQYIDNLECISKAENARRNQMQYKKHPVELRPTVRAMARLVTKTHEIARDQ